jgi:hypothetical protein
LERKPAHKGKKIADFFFLNRGITCEVKSLNKDTNEKVEKIIDSLRGRDDFPVFYGEWDVKKILRHLHDGDKIHEKMAYLVTSPIEDQIKDANRQIRDTMSIFQRLRKAGLVIIVNRAVKILDARVIQWRISQCLNKKTSDGLRRFESIDAVWLIDEAHHLLVSKKDSGPIMVNIEGDGGEETKFVSEYIEYLCIQWASWNGRPLLHPPAEILLNRDRLYSANDLKKIPGEMQRHEYWRECYKRKPYLRSLLKEQFLEYGRNLMKEITPFFLKDGKKGTKAQIMFEMEKFTHLLEEVNHRGIDMREFKFNTVDLSTWIKK